MARGSAARAAGIIFGVLAAATQSAATKDDNFDDWCIHYGREYASDEERILRRGMWHRNLHLVTEHNARAERGESGFTMAMTRNADLSASEFAARIAASSAVHPSQHERTLSATDVKEDAPAGADNSTGLRGGRALQGSVDWTAAGYVNPSVFSGANCNSAYASATAGTVEARWKQLHGGSLLVGSAQELVDCTGTWGGNGCMSGDPWQMMVFIQYYGLENGAPGYYSLTGSTGTCQANIYAPPIMGINNRILVTPYSIPPLLSSLDVGPTIVGVYTGQVAIQLYGSGVIDDPYYCDGLTFDNFWLATGYGTAFIGNQVLDYWKIRSDWGTDYGEDGYVRIKRTLDFNSGGLCGVLRWSARAA